jgi:outer membrane protein assembly factor BamB
VAFGPTVLGDIVLALTPVAGSGNPTVKAQGLNVVTGKVLWTVPQPIEISGPLRNMAVAQPGSTEEGDLWQTDASTPTLAQTSAAGQVVWTHTVAGLFGGSQYDPDVGWDFLIQGSLDVGSIGTTSSGSTVSLNDSKTLAISGSDGTIKWTVPGYFRCGGGLQFLTTDIVCQYSGTAHRTATSFSMSGISLTLTGLDPSSGKTTWSQPVLGTQALSEGTNVAFADGTHLVVQLPSHQRVVLDVQNGATSAIAGHQVFWCEQVPEFKVNTFKGAQGGGTRVSAPVFRPCSATGKASTGLPANGPSTVGVRAGGLFIWPIPHGLQAARIPG